MNGKMGLLEYLCFRYSKSVAETIAAPQGDNSDAIEQAQLKFNAVQVCLLSWGK